MRRCNRSQVEAIRRKGAPSARAFHAAVSVAPGVLLVTGGCNEDGQGSSEGGESSSAAGACFRDAALFDARSLRWAPAPASLSAFPALAAPARQRAAALVLRRCLATLCSGSRTLLLPC